MQNLCSFSEARNGVCQYVSSAMYFKCAAPNHREMFTAIEKVIQKAPICSKTPNLLCLSTQLPECTALSCASHLHQLHSPDPSIPSSSHVYLHLQIKPIQIKMKSPSLPCFSPYGAKRDSGSASRLPPSCLLLWFKHFTWSPSNTPLPPQIPALSANMILGHRQKQYICR